jgi:hypothetical protein
MTLPIDRRTMLRGAGVAVALPLLEAMLPIRQATAQSALAPSRSLAPPRLAICYFGTGMNMNEFTPADDGPEFTPSKILQPLAGFRRDMTVLTGTWLRYGGAHTGDYTFLTGAKAHTSHGITNSLSADQLAAEHIGRETRFPSLQFSVSRGTGFGGSMKTLAWNRSGTPLASESDPRAIFDRLFRTDGPAERTQQQRAIARRASILDAIADQSRRLERRVGRDDRRQIDHFLTSVRAVEKQLERDIDWAERPRPEIAPDRASAFARSLDPETTRDFHYATYSPLMYDLIALAFQTDSTRIISYVVRQELRGGVYPEFGVSKGYHELSHHNHDPRNLDELARVDMIYMQHFAHLLERLKATPQVDGTTLLDQTLVAFSSGMGMDHSPDRLPTAVFGGRALGMAHQGHLRLPERTPLSALWQTLLDRIGVPVGKDFQDSPGPISQVIT